jgi:DNA adenine methylase
MKPFELEQSLKTKNGYKRYKNPYLRYAGGKSLAVGHLLNKLPDDIDKLISPFFGAGSFELALSQECNINVIGYDIFEPLTLFWKYIINDKEIFTDTLLTLKADKETYEKIRKIVSDKSFNSLDDLTKASYFYYNHNNSYGPGFPGWSSSVYLNQQKWENKISLLKNNELNNLQVYCDDFVNVIDKCDGFLYLDPPYYLSGKMFKGIYPSRNRPFNHNNFKHQELFEMLNNYKYKWMLSYNDCDEIKSLYKNFNFYFPEWQYTMGQGETRIGKNRLNDNNNHIKKSHEILITNY